MHKKGRNGQAALEFLTTYSWAFMLMLVLVGGMAYFGVLSPSQLIPNKCVASTGFVCSESSLGSDSAVLFLRNGPQAVTFSQNAVVKIQGGTTECEISATMPAQRVSANSIFTVSLATTDDCVLPEKALLSLEVGASYRIVNDPFPKSLSIQLTGKVPKHCDAQCQCQSQVALGYYWEENTEVCEYDPTHCQGDGSCQCVFAGGTWDGLNCDYGCSPDNDECSCLANSGSWDSVCGCSVPDNSECMCNAGGGTWDGLNCDYGCSGDLSCTCRENYEGNFYSPVTNRCEWQYVFAVNYECQETTTSILYSPYDDTSSFESLELFEDEELTMRFRGTFIYNGQPYIWDDGYYYGETYCTQPIDVYDDCDFANVIDTKYVTDLSLTEDTLVLNSWSFTHEMADYYTGELYYGGSLFHVSDGLLGYPHNCVSSDYCPDGTEYNPSTDHCCQDLEGYWYTEFIGYDCAVIDSCGGTNYDPNSEMCCSIQGTDYVVYGDDYEWICPPFCDGNVC
jgi:hypothetical protein